MELLFKGLNPSYPNDVGIEVTPAKNFRENERKLLQQSGLDRFGKTEAWTASVPARNCHTRRTVYFATLENFRPRLPRI